MATNNDSPIAEEYSLPIIDLTDPLAVNIEEATCTCGCKKPPA